ncbi:methionine ABC transporter substrate-binding protein [Campylobacter sp. MIT 12-8780]|uniref:MetQ/NlpA family ABC transporter substrate-binding protein n=1 Tax=Campylobacter sp. MIT 12-8780 TaxID=2202200 RepID=UPI00115E9481|nr:MetQ/NlpA family ABC transporter substrate-binding protein [Campylobacter sp. MIT 12-8780]TQR40625.1 methionine ABC transporter substrate-binding protein [Campylobacter sp. MIT 12-8780]
MKLKTLLLASILGLTTYANAEKIIVGATPVPHAEILQFIKPNLAKAGFELEIKEFNDYVQPNLATDSGELDANFFQHTPYLNEFNKNKGTKLVSVAGIHLEPMGVYSKKFKNIKELKNGAKIAIPNDPTNESRALNIIASTKAIEFKDAQKELKTPLDISKNDLKLKFLELKAAQLPRALEDADFAVINSNYAMAANLNPVKDSLVIESKDSPYVNILVVKAGNENTAKTKALIKALQSNEVKKFIEEKYQGAVIPAF